MKMNKKTIGMVDPRSFGTLPGNVDIVVTYVPVSFFYFFILNPDPILFNPFS